MFSDTGWTEPTWNTNFIQAHRGGYKVVGDWVYVNIRFQTKNSAQNFGDSTHVAVIPSGYRPAHTDSVWAISAGCRYPENVQITRDSGYIRINGGIDANSWAGVIAFYKYQ